MAYKVIWLPKAEEQFENIIAYLQDKWTQKEISHFINKTERVIQLISSQPRLFRKSSKKNIHEVLITKHNLLIYRLQAHVIELLTFFDTRQNPKIKYKYIK